MVKPTREEILKYIKNPIVRKDKNKIKKEKNIERIEAVTFINTVNIIIKNLGNIEELSTKELNDKIDLLLVTPPPPSPESRSPTPTEEEEIESYRNGIKKQLEAACRVEEKRFGLKKGALKVGSISFSDDEGKGIKKKKKSVKRKRRKSLGRNSKKKRGKKSGRRTGKKGKRRGKRSVKRSVKRRGKKKWKKF